MDLDDRPVAPPLRRHQRPVRLERRGVRAQSDHTLGDRPSLMRRHRAGRWSRDRAEGQHGDGDREPPYEHNVTQPPAGAQALLRYH
jgi:hypothetical protein